MARRYIRHDHETCEHCDRPWEDGHLVRWDALRGYVCPDCDLALDEMLFPTKVAAPAHEKEG